MPRRTCRSWCGCSTQHERFLWYNVRIHLDEAAGRGAFLEFEAILRSPLDDVAGEVQLGKLARQFGITAPNPVAGS